MSDTTTPKATAQDAGCWLEGSRGWRISADIVDLAGDFGMPLSNDDRKIIDVFRGGERDYATLSDGTEANVHDHVLDQGGLADSALDYLNEHVAPEGYSFDWNDGELFLWSDESWAELA